MLRRWRARDNSRTWSTAACFCKSAVAAATSPIKDGAQRRFTRIIYMRHCSVSQHGRKIREPPYRLRQATGLQYNISGRWQTAYRILIILRRKPVAYDARRASCSLTVFKRAPCCLHFSCRPPPPARLRQTDRVGNLLSPADGIGSSLVSHTWLVRESRRC